MVFKVEFIGTKINFSKILCKSFARINFCRIFALAKPIEVLHEFLETRLNSSVG